MSSTLPPDPALAAAPLPDVPDVPDAPDAVHDGDAAAASPANVPPDASEPVGAEPRDTESDDTAHAADGAPATTDTDTPAGTPRANGATLSPEACAQALKTRFPALFRGAAKPLKLRIQADIQQRAPGVFSKAALSGFLRRHTSSTSYLIALSNATQRFDLDGAPAGELADEHRQAAQEELARRRNSRVEREALEIQQRRNRAQLLRDFETNKLTVANFCALKGVAPEELDGLLALAREEKAQAPLPPPSRPPGRPGDGRDGPQRDGRGQDTRGPQDRPPRDARGPRTDGRPEPRREPRNDAGRRGPPRGPKAG